MMLYLLWTITILASIFCIAYLFLVGAFCIGWQRTKNRKSASSGKVSVAVILPARNEGANLGNCLRALEAQVYNGKVELIIVDDHSEDNTAALAEAYCSSHPGVRLLKAEGTGKKNAIATAIKSTDAELIITTDADCTMGPAWIERIVSFYEESGARMIVGPVAFSGEHSGFEKMQSLELMALVGSTGGSLYFNRPIMCSGANLAYPRKIFQEMDGFEGLDHIASGDDVLLMYKIADKYPEGVKFLKDPSAIVYTKALSSIAEFFRQRRRWASKGFSLLNSETKLVSLVVYLFCLLILLMGLLSTFASLKSAVYQPFLQICLILAVIKCVIDFLLLFLAASFFKKRRYLYLFLPEQFVYILYVVLAGMPWKKRYEWKGRKI